MALLLLGICSLGIGRTFDYATDYSDAMKKETQTVIFLLENYHYSQKFIDNSQTTELLHNFMEDLDYNHVFFLQSDVDELVERYARRLERNLRRGDLRAAYSIYAVYEQRVMERIEWVKKRLEGEFDFSVEAEYVVDRGEFPWLADATEADELWENRLKYELLFDLLNDEENEEAVNTVTRRYDRLAKNMEDLEAVDVQEVFLTTLTQMFDPHSTFLSSDTLEDFAIQMSLSLVGIGAILTQEDGYCTIRELIPGGPADLDGRLQPKDRIIEVAQVGEDPVDVIDMKLRKIVKMIRGEKNTTVYLTVIPADAVDPSIRKTIDLVRDEVEISAQRASASLYELPEMSGDTLPVGVIHLPSFYGDISLEESGSTTSTTKDVEELIGRLQEEGISGLVLDLRDNGGGLLNEAIDLTGLFIETGPVVQVRNSRGFIRRDWDRDSKISYHGPLVVLISRYSASASEIVAGALQYYDRALIVGDKSTHGKGTVQAVFEIDRLASPSFFKDQPTGAAKLTIQKFYLPDGISTQNKGVISDVPLPSHREFLPIGEADLPQAMEWDEINPVNWTSSKVEPSTKFRPIDDSFISKLRAQSEARQSVLQEFSFLKKSISVFKERQETNAFSLNLEKRLEIKESDKLIREELEASEDELEKYFFPSKKIVLVDPAEDPAATTMGEQPVAPAPETDPDVGKLLETAMVGDTPLEDDPATVEPVEEGTTSEEEEGPILDIHLRESLRILADWIDASNLKGADTAWASPHERTR